MKSTNPNLGRKRPVGERDTEVMAWHQSGGEPGETEPEGAGIWLYGQFRQEVTSPGSPVTDFECAKWSACQRPGLFIETEHHKHGLGVPSCRRGDVWKPFYF